MIALSLALACALPPDFHANRYDYHLAAGIAFSVPLDLLNGPIAKANHEKAPSFGARFAYTAFSGWGIGFAKEGLDMGLGKTPDLKDATWTLGGVMGGFLIFEGAKALFKRKRGYEVRGTLTLIEASH